MGVVVVADAPALCGLAPSARRGRDGRGSRSPGTPAACRAVPRSGMPSVIRTSTAPCSSAIACRARRLSRCCSKRLGHPGVARRVDVPQGEVVASLEERILGGRGLALRRLRQDMVDHRGDGQVLGEEAGQAEGLLARQEAAVASPRTLRACGGSARRCADPEISACGRDSRRPRRSRETRHRR